MSSFELHLAQLPHRAWTYKLSERDAATMICERPMTRDEVSAALQRRWGRPEQYLKPCGGDRAEP